MIRPLTPADQPAVETFLLAHLATSMFLVNNIRASGIVDGQTPFYGAYVGQFDAHGAVTGVAAHYWNGNVMVQSPANAATLARAVLTHSGRPLRGLVGDGAQCAAVLHGLGLDAATFQLSETEGLFHLPTTQLDAPGSDDFVRRAQAQDRDALVSMYAEYETEALNETDHAQAHASAANSVDLRLRGGRQFVLEREGEIVSASSFNAQVDGTVQIGSVWTPPKWRSRGFARTCVAGSIAIARETGITDAILFTGDANIAARKAYAAIGFREIGTFYISLTGRDVWVKSGFAP